MAGPGWAKDAAWRMWMYCECFQSLLVAALPDENESLLAVQNQNLERH